MINIVKYIESVGGYFLFIRNVFTQSMNKRVFWEFFKREIDDLILKSVGIVVFISTFIGGVISIQTALNLKSPLIPLYIIGFTARQTMILEFAPTFICVVLSGKVGSYITSSIGTMKITSQVEALKIMGVNANNLLVMPKIITTLIFFPFLIVISIFFGILGGWLAGYFTELFDVYYYMEGLWVNFQSFHFVYAMIKTLFFAFFIATIPAFMGMRVKGGSIDVGRASTQAVVWTTVMIVFTNYILTQLLLS